jgi:hypothetical protein
VEEQPLIGLVTVSVYVPTADALGFCDVDEKLLGPDQLYVTPEVEELPESVTDVTEHVIGPLTLAVAPGAVIFWVTVVFTVEVQP